jgi:hypothetical protein
MSLLYNEEVVIGIFEVDAAAYVRNLIELGF